MTETARVSHIDVSYELRDTGQCDPQDLKIKQVATYSVVRELWWFSSRRQAVGVFGHRRVVFQRMAAMVHPAVCGIRIGCKLIRISLLVRCIYN